MRQVSKSEVSKFKGEAYDPPAKRSCKKTVRNGEAREVQIRLEDDANAKWGFQDVLSSRRLRMQEQQTTICKP